MWSTTTGSRTKPQSFGAASVASEWNLPENYALFIGRLAEEKNVLALLRAFAEYAKRNGTWHLVFAGDGPMRKSMEAAIEQLNIRCRVRIEGMNQPGYSPIPAFAEEMPCSTELP